MKIRRHMQHSLETSVGLWRDAQGCAITGSTQHSLMHEYGHSSATVYPCQRARDELLKV